jgi:NADH-quinone oxidoreductase subunit L
MEGPTPVSALIHAATLVIAGVVLMIRCSILFENSDSILTIVSIVGAITAFFCSFRWFVSKRPKACYRLFYL